MGTNLGNILGVSSLVDYQLLKEQVELTFAKDSASLIETLLDVVASIDPTHPELIETFSKNSEIPSMAQVVILLKQHIDILNPSFVQMFSSDAMPLSLTSAISLILEKLGIKNEENETVIEQGPIASQLDAMNKTTGTDAFNVTMPTLVHSINNVAAKLGADSNMIESAKDTISMTDSMVEIASIVGLGTVEAETTFVE